MKKYIRNKEITVSQSVKKHWKLFQQNCQWEHIVTNRNFWKIIKPFLSNKGHLENVDIMLRHNNKIICNDHELVKIFNEHYINFIEKLGEEKPTNITKEYSFDNDKQAADIICNSYKDHPNVLVTEKENTNDNTIFLPVNSDKVKQCLQKLKSRKVICQDKIPINNKRTLSFKFLTNEYFKHIKDLRKVC